MKTRGWGEGTAPDSARFKPQSENRKSDRFLDQCQVTSFKVRSWHRVFSLCSFHFPLIIIVLPLPHTHLSPPPEVCHSPEQGAHYHILGASSLSKKIAGYGVRELFGDVCVNCSMCCFVRFNNGFSYPVSHFVFGIAVVFLQFSENMRRDGSHELPCPLRAQQPRTLIPFTRNNTFVTLLDFPLTSLSNNQFWLRAPLRQTRVQYFQWRYDRFLPHPFQFITHQNWAGYCSGNAPDRHSRGPRFESHLGHLLSWEAYSGFTQLFQVNNTSIGHDHFH
jgi:hypothetical protein